MKPASENAAVLWTLFVLVGLVGVIFGAALSNDKVTSPGDVYCRGYADATVLGVAYSEGTAAAQQAVASGANEQQANDMFVRTAVDVFDDFRDDGRLAQVAEQCPAEFEKLVAYFEFLGP